MMRYEFEWDLSKEIHNIRKHGCAFEEAMEVFADPDVIHLEDPKHSSEEDRYYAIGKTLKGNVLTVRYTWRGRKIRIYGAARWRRWERFYEEETRSRKTKKD